MVGSGAHRYYSGPRPVIVRPLEEEIHVPVIPSAARRSPLRRAFILFVAIAALTVPAIALAAKPPGAGQGQNTTIKILDISDWHAQIDPNGGTGGAEALSDYFKAERTSTPNTIT